MPASLEGKVAIVTGAASPRGLGRAMTAALVRAGARVAMIDVNAQWLDEAAAAMRDIGGTDSVTTRVTDVSSAADAEACVAHTVAELGGLHLLVNNAGITRQKMLAGDARANRFWEIPADEWDRITTAHGRVDVADVKRARHPLDLTRQLRQVLAQFRACKLALQRDAHGMIGQRGYSGSTVVLAQRLVANEQFHDLVANHRVARRCAAPARLRFGEVDQRPDA